MAIKKSDKNEKVEMNPNGKLVIRLSVCILLSAILLCCLFFSFYNLKKSTEKIYAQNIEKVVEIKSSTDGINWGYATGCFIDSNGTILTNKHAVFNSSTNQNFSKIQIRLASSEEYMDATIVKISDEFDLATIKATITKTKHFNLAKKVKTGQQVYTIGNPNNFGLSFSQGVVSSNTKNVVYNGKTINAMQTDFVINEGNSGGPVFNSNGNLIGLISFRLKNNEGYVVQGVSFAVPLENIKAFLG